MERLSDTQVDHVKEIVEDVADTSVKKAFTEILKKLEKIVDAMAFGLDSRIGKQDKKFERLTALQEGTDKAINQLSGNIKELARAAEANEKAISNMLTRWQTMDEMKARRNQKVLVWTAVITCAVGVMTFMVTQTVSAIKSLNASQQVDVVNTRAIVPPQVSIKGDDHE